MEKVKGDLLIQYQELLDGEEYETTREAVCDLMFSMHCICDPDNTDEYEVTDIVKGVKDFLSTIPRNNMKKSMDHIILFMLFNGPKCLVSLFYSPIKGNKEIAEESIRLFLISPKSKTDVFLLPRRIQNQCGLLVLLLGNLLRTCTDDYDNSQGLFYSCRETILSILKSTAFANTNTKRSTYFGYKDPSLLIRELYPFLADLRLKLCRRLELISEQPSLSTMSSTCLSLSFARDVREFAILSLHMRRAIEDYARSVGQSLPWRIKNVSDEDDRCYPYGIDTYYNNYLFLRRVVKFCLIKLGKYIRDGAVGISTKFNPMWSCYLSLLKELNYISKFFEGEDASTIFAKNWLSVNYLIMHSKRIDEHQWILDEHKNVINFESRINLLMTMMFPVVKYEDEKCMHTILIDRSQLLTESFEQIAHANPKSLHNCLSVSFKNEVSTGDGVLREWLLLVCQALFDPNSSLFLACPSDRRRFFPNPASMDPRDLNYFAFCGRVIALALMHKVQVGIVFDRVFFLQLAGKEISLEDVRYADPYKYNSCKKILEMDADFVDSDAMGLTFINEIEVSGSREIVELCPGGKTIVVNSKNREEYVNLFIQHCFVKSVSAKVACFAKGFGDILCKRRLQKFFFQSLELKDLDCLLLGNDKAISVKDWKAHTDYDDYKETDDQILWFWKVVEDMSVEQQRELLFFWTSVKYLPINGFSGVPSRLCIYNTKGSNHNMLSSQTCFYRLGLPHYQSLAFMQQHLFLISQEQMGHSYGFS